MENGKRYFEAYVICYVFSVLIILVTLCIICIYIKTKEFRSYPCYFNILLSSVIALDNIIRIIPVSGDDESIMCLIQGFSLALFDKLMLTTMTVYSLISFLGIIKIELYKIYEKWIFIVLTSAGFLISLVLAVLFIINGTIKYDDICYVRSKSDEKKEIKINKELIDIIVTSILFAINVICIVYLLIYLFLTIRESKKKRFSNLQNMSFHFWKFIFNFLLNDLTFILVILIISDSFLWPDEFISLSYIILGLLIIIFYTINHRVLIEIKKIICCIKEEQTTPLVNPEQEEEYNNNSYTSGGGSLMPDN
jgi:hypothetical protein